MKFLTAALTVLIFVTFTGCSKDPEQAKGTMTFTLDGTDFRFEQYTSASIDNLGGRHSINIEGHDTQPSQLFLYFLIDCPTALDPGTYNHNIADRDTTVTAFINFGQEPSQQIFSAGYVENDPNPVTVTITSFAGKRVKGTFGFTVSLNGENRVVTNGTFDIPYVFVKPG